MHRWRGGLAAGLGLVVAACTGRAITLGAGDDTEGTAGSGDDAGAHDGPTASHGSGGADGTGDGDGDDDGDDGDDAMPPSWSTEDRDVDILVVLDNSGSMGEEQPILVEALQSMVEVLERPEVNADYRIAITTTDVGNPSCSGTTPESGRFVASSCRARADEFVVGSGASTNDASQIACFDVCPAEWADIPMASPWIERIDGVSNLPAGLGAREALGCLVPVGISGCGVESPLEAMSRALAHARTPGEAELGFLREDAALVVLVVTDEIDGSTNVGMESIWSPDGGRVFWSDPTDAAPTSAVAWNAGVACTGASPYDECHAVDLGLDGHPVPPGEADGAAVLVPLSRYIDELQAIEDAKPVSSDDREVRVLVIAGAQSDGQVVYADAVGDPAFQHAFGIGPGCSSERGTAVPPVRLRQLAEAFGLGGAQNLFSICDADYGGVSEAIAGSFAGQVQPMCLPECVADGDPSTPSLEPSCVVEQDEPFGDGSIVTTEIPPCTANGELPSASDDACVLYLTGAFRSSFCAEQGANLELVIVHREGVTPNGGTTIRADCQLDPACPSPPPSGS